MTEEITDESDEAIEEEREKLQVEADKAKIESEDDTEKNVEAEEDGNATEESEEEEKQGYEDTDTPDIPVRDTASQIIARQKRTIEKLRSKDDDDEEVDEDVIDSDDDELTPESRTAVQREIERQVAPLVDNLSKKSDEDELQELFTDEPDAKGYEKTIRAYMGHESYQGVPPKVIFAFLDRQHAESRGASRKQAADLEARQMSGAGSSSRPAERPTGDLPTAEEIDAMSDKEFEKLEHKARTGGFVKAQ